MTYNIAHFPILEVIQTAWSKVKGSKGTFFIIGLFYLLTQGAQAWLNTVEHFLPLTIFFTLVLAITQLILLWGIIYLGAQRATDTPIHYSMIKHVIHLDLFLKMIGYYLLQMLILALPTVIFLLLMLIPFLTPMLTHIPSGIIISFLFAIVAAGLIIFLLIRLCLTPIIIITQSLGPWAAIKLSFHTTRSNVCRLFLLMIINSLIFAISAIPFGIGLIWSIPYLAINYGVVYRKLIPQP